MDCSLPFPSPGYIPDPVLNWSAPLQADALSPEPAGKPFNCEGNNKLWKSLKEIRILDHNTCFQGSMQADQDMAVGIGKGIMNWYKIGNEINRGDILSSS